MAKTRNLIYSKAWHESLNPPLPKGRELYVRISTSFSFYFFQDSPTNRFFVGIDTMISNLPDSNESHETSYPEKSHGHAKNLSIYRLWSYMMAYYLIPFRPRAHNREVPVANATMRKNFIYRMLYLDSY